MQSITCRFSFLLVPAISVALSMLGCDRTDNQSAADQNHATRVSTATASPKVHVAGLRTDTMNYYASEQLQSEWCWAACIQMVLSTRQINLSQNDIVNRAFGSLTNTPADLELIVRNLDGWRVAHGNRSTRLTATLGRGRPPIEVLVDSLTQNVPVLVALQPSGGEGHAVVVTAVIYEDTDSGPQIRSVIGRDPAPSFRGTLGKRKLNPEEFSDVSAYLRVCELESPQAAVH